MRVLLDTNVLIAAFIARGTCHELFEHCAQQHLLVTSKMILAELREKLTGKFKYSAADADESEKLVRAKAELVVPSALADSICRDPNDYFVLAAALAGACNCLITDDKDLLVLRHYKEIAIIMPIDFSTFEETANAGNF